MAGSILYQRSDHDKDYWIRYIQTRINRNNKNFLGFMSGSTGSGKSYSCNSIAYLADIRQEFTVDRCYFSIKELVKDVKERKLRKGNLAVVEEVGVLANNREWRSHENTALNYLIQIFRKDNLGVLFNAPSWYFFDSSSRKMLHALFKTVKIDYAEKTCLVKPYLLQYNDEIDKTYKKFLRVRTPNGTIPIKSWKIPSPPKDLVKAYEEKKTAFNDSIYSKLGIMLTPEEKSAKLREHQHNWIIRIRSKTRYCRNCGAEEPMPIPQTNEPPVLNLFDKKQQVTYAPYS